MSKWAAVNWEPKYEAFCQLSVDQSAHGLFVRRELSPIPARPPGVDDTVELEPEPIVSPPGTQVRSKPVQKLDG